MHGEINQFFWKKNRAESSACKKKKKKKKHPSQAEGKGKNPLS